MALAVDEPGPIRAALAEVRALAFGGLVTVERARLLGTSPPRVRATSRPWRPDAVKLTLHLARRARGDGGPAHVVAVAALHRHGVAGATVLLGVDGTARGRRERARLVGRNARVPLLVLSVADPGTLRPALAELAALRPAPWPRSSACASCGAPGRRSPRRGRSRPRAPRPSARVKVTVIASEQALVHRRLSTRCAVRRGGATALRGTWGFHGEHRPTATRCSRCAAGCRSRRSSWTTRPARRAGGRSSRRPPRAPASSPRSGSPGRTRARATDGAPGARRGATVARVGEQGCWGLRPAERASTTRRSTLRTCGVMPAEGA